MGLDFKELLLLRLEIEALNAEFAYLIDHDLSEGVADLFTVDGVYGRSTGGRSVGREAIRESYKRRKSGGPRTARHVFTNLRLTPVDDGRVKGTCILTLYARDGLPPHPADPMVVADYDDIYERGDDGRWRFKERIISWIFERDDAASPLVLGGAQEKR
ncbi:nuclear transport factor 2 family protein [Chelativorans sp.]|uniref:nuclear transport factor 2 family protein n=1 Tax=Chelativorans sp. TaxID=2203393 RepID=UPI0028115C2C|nr:nuclear transport factor 2 family protein [Chelativorans sp.]